MATMRKALSSSLGFLLLIMTLGLPIFSQAVPDSSQRPATTDDSSRCC